MSIILREEWNTDLEESIQALYSIAEVLENVELPILASRRVAMSDMAQRFQTEVDPDGQPWVPLSEDYLLDKRKSESGHPDDILQLTGEMEAAATSEDAWIVTENALMFDASNLPFYAMIHQEGSDPFGVAGTFTEQGTYVAEMSEGVGTGYALPQRKWIGLSEEAETKIEAIFDLWFEDATSLAINPVTGFTQVRLPSGRFGGALE